MADKAKKKKRLLYAGTAQMENALAAVKAGMPVRTAAKDFGVPKSTLHDRIRQRYGEDPVPGRPPALPSAIEEKIVDTLKEASRQGLGVSRKQLLARTGELCRRHQMAAFKRVSPSKQWWESVKQRHPELTIRRPEKLSSARASMLNPVVVKNYMDQLGKCLSDLGLTQSPAKIWNCDETGRNFEHTPVRVIAEKGIKNVVGKTSTSRTNVTIMACVNAAGEYMPPMLIVKGKTAASLHGYNTSASPQGTKWTYQENGWINDSIAETWFKEIFLKSCDDERPQLLILDGHASHETLALLQLARDHQISLLCLPPHTTHLLQPLDRSVFGPFSSAFNAACSNYLNQNPLNTVNKWSFPGLVKQAWEAAFTSSNIINGFRACGVYPFNASAVPLDGFAPSNPTERPPPPTSVCISSLSQATVRSLPPSTVSASSTSRPTEQLLPSSTVSASFTSRPTEPMLPSSTVSASFTSRPTEPMLPSSTVSAMSTPRPIEKTLPICTIPADSSLSSLRSSMTPNPMSPSPAPFTTPVRPESATSASLIVHPLQSMSEIEENCADNESAELLLNLLGNGAVTVEPCPTVSLWDSEIENLFLPPKLSSSNLPKVNVQRKQITTHRLLTSDEVIQEKQQIQLNKENREKIKLERALKREQNKKNKC